MTASPDAAAPDTAITVVIADDHAIVRAGLRLLLEAEQGMSVVAEAGDVPDVMLKVRGHHPRVLILDLNLPGVSGLTAIPDVLETSPETRIVVLTMQNDPVFAREALGAGALGYVLKEAADAELVSAVRYAAAGQMYVNPGLGARLARGGGGPGEQPAPLSAREIGGAGHDRQRPHERGDRRKASPERADDRVAPRSHPPQDRPDDAGGARRARTGARRRELISNAAG